MAAIYFGCVYSHFDKHSQSGSEFTLMWVSVAWKVVPVLLRRIIWAFKIKGWRGIFNLVWWFF